MGARHFGEQGGLPNGGKTYEADSCVSGRFHVPAITAAAGAFHLILDLLTSELSKLSFQHANMRHGLPIKTSQQK